MLHFTGTLCNAFTLIDTTYFLQESRMVCWFSEAINVCRWEVVLNVSFMSMRNGQENGVKIQNTVSTSEF